VGTAHHRCRVVEIHGIIPIEEVGSAHPTASTRWPQAVVPILDEFAGESYCPLRRMKVVAARG